MDEGAWSWAELDEAQLERVDEAEREVGADFVLVYRQRPGVPAAVPGNVRPAALEADRVERLRELEREVDGVAVAYERR